MATTFPGSIQTFPNMIDIAATDGANIAQYQTYIQQGNMAQANAVLQNIPSYANKFINANLMNSAFDTTVALENYYLQRYSSAYIVSSTMPPTQAATDFWFQVIT